MNARSGGVRKYVVLSQTKISTETRNDKHLLNTPQRPRGTRVWSRAPSDNETWWKMGLQHKLSKKYHVVNDSDYDPPGEVAAAAGKKYGIHQGWI